MAKDASPLREIRTRLGLSQAECATALGVALETLRTWDAGRRTAPEAIVSQARTLKEKGPSHDRVLLQVLADELHVHVKTLRAASHDGARDAFRAFVHPPAAMQAALQAGGWR
jgi:transcriptional regulator with XRE-family HTH domain